MRARKRPHILYVENDIDSCQMMTSLLELSGIDVTCAQGVAAALLLPDKNKFDLFLLDLWLHDGDGNDLCLKLRTEFPDTPVVFYTGCATQQERKQGLASGAAAYLVKPYSDLIAPTIFELVTGGHPIDEFSRPVDPLTHFEHHNRKSINIIKGASKAMPLSP
jgi:CheY-like chemotaxis protein